jgi:hypothetical protein
MTPDEITVLYDDMAKIALDLTDINKVLIPQDRLELIRNLTKLNRERLENIYGRLIEEEDQFSISSFIRYRQRSDQYRAGSVKKVLYLLQILHENRVTPFLGVLVKYRDTERNTICDWSFLPVELSWIGPAVDLINSSFPVTVRQDELVEGNRVTNQARMSALRAFAQRLEPEQSKLYESIKSVDEAVYVKKKCLEDVIVELYSIM